MVVRYDTLDRLEKPVMTLCNPGAQYQNGKLTNAICCLFDTEAEEFVGNFNSISELNFRVNRVEYEDIEKDNAALRMYSSIKNRRMIFVEDIGFFVITNVEEKIENEVKYKDVSAGSVDTELQQRMLPYIPDGTYRFSTDGADIGLLDKIVSTLALWQIGHVDHEVAIRYRTFESVETNQNCLSFMIDKMQEAYECIILFDPIYRLINVYDQDTYTSNQDVQTDIHISTDDIVNSVTVTEGSEDLYTAIRVFGGDNDNVYISCVNPTGQNVIYDFSYYYDWMSDGLRAKIIEWEEDVADAQTEYENKNKELDDLIDVLNNLGKDLEVVLVNIDICERTLANIEARASKDSIKVSEEGLKAIAYADEDFEIQYETNIDVDTQDYTELEAAVLQDLNDLNTAKADINRAIDAKQAQVDSVSGEILAITSGLDFRAQGRLSDAEFEELQNYIFEGEYKDEYALITEKMTNADKFEQRKQMYDRAKKQLARTSHPTQEFSIDTDGFVFAKVFSKFTDKLETGRIINIGIDELYSQTSMFFLSSIEINFDDKKMSLTIGNRYNKFDPRSLFENVLGSVSRSANTISYLKDVVYPLKAGEIDEVKEALQNVRNITMANAIAAEDQSVIIDSTGYTGRRSDGEGGFDPEQVKIVNNSIVFTDDAWDTCRTALGKMTIPDPEHPGQDMTVYGLIADAIIGNLVLSQNVTVKNDDSSIVLNEDGIKFDGGLFEKNEVIDIEAESYETKSIVIDCTSYWSTINLGNALYHIKADILSGLFHNVSVDGYKAYVVVDGDDNYYPLTLYTDDVNDFVWLNYNYDTDAYSIGEYFKDRTKPAFAIKGVVNSGLLYNTEIRSTFEPEQTYHLVVDLPSGTIVRIDSNGISVTEKDDTSTKVTGTDIFSYFRNLFAKIQKHFSLNQDGLLNKIGYKIYSTITGDRAAFSSDVIAFQDGADEDNISYFGLYGAKVPRIMTDSIYTTEVSSPTIQYSPNDVLTMTNINFAGMITTSTTKLYATIPLDKTIPTDLINKITVTNMTYTPRGVNGYIGFVLSDDTIVLPGSSNDYRLTWSRSNPVNYMDATITQRPSSGNTIRIEITAPYGFYNVPNNTPVSLYCHSISIKFEYEVT